MTAPTAERVVAPSTRERTVLLGAAALCAVGGIVSWRQGALYAGGADPTVLAKAAVAGVAFLLALVLDRTAPARRALSPYPLLLVLTAVGVSVVGGLADGAVGPAAVLATRVVLLAATLVLLLRSAPTLRVLGMLLGAMAAVGVVSATTGAIAALLRRDLASRLTGGVPPLAANELATLLLPPAIALVVLVTRRRPDVRAVVALVVLTGFIAWTGSRTALAMLLLAAVLVVVTSRVVPRRVLIGLAVAAVALLLAALATGVLSGLLLRGEGVGRLLTLNSRTISWSVVLATPSDTLSWWIGRGLTVKQIAVTGQYWETQVFDSSWISALAQTGVVGTLLLAVYAVGTLLGVTQPGPLRRFALPILVTALVRSFVENGLLDANPTFLLVLLLALVVWPGASERFVTRPVRRRSEGVTLRSTKAQSAVADVLR